MQCVGGRANPAAVELHCAVEVRVQSLVMPQRHMPRFVDVVTLAELDSNGDESSIAPLPSAE